MVAQPNPTYDPETGLYRRLDGSIVQTGRAAARTTVLSQPLGEEQDFVMGSIGCCDAETRWTIPTELLKTAFRDAVPLGEVWRSPEILFHAHGRPVSRPHQFTANIVAKAAETPVGWGTYPFSPFSTSYNQVYRQTTEFADWVEENPPLEPS